MSYIIAASSGVFAAVLTGLAFGKPAMAIADASVWLLIGVAQCWVSQRFFGAST